MADMNSTATRAVPRPRTRTTKASEAVPMYGAGAGVLSFRHGLRSPLAVDPLARHQSIENALSMALWHVRHDTGTYAIQAATGRAIRAASMLKQACTEATDGGRD